MALNEPGKYQKAVWSRNGQTLAVIKDSRSIQLFKQLKRAQTIHVPSTQLIYSIVYKGNHSIIVGLGDGSVEEINLNTGHWRKLFITSQVPAFISVSLDQEQVVCGVDHELIYWSESGGQHSIKLEVTCGQFSRFQKSLVGCGSANGQVILIEQGKVIKLPSPHNLRIVSINFSKHNKYLMVAASVDGQFSLYDVEKKTLVKAVQVGTAISCTTFHQDGKTLAIGTGRGKVLIYDLVNGKSIRDIESKVDAEIVDVAYQAIIKAPAKTTSIPAQVPQASPVAPLRVAPPAPFSPVVTKQKYGTKVIEAYQQVSEKIQQLETNFSALNFNQLVDEEQHAASSAALATQKFDPAVVNPPVSIKVSCLGIDAETQVDQVQVKEVATQTDPIVDLQQLKLGIQRDFQILYIEMLKQFEQQKYELQSLLIQRK